MNTFLLLSLPTKREIFLPAKKIIIRVRGGLGNQLFIYAFARYLSLNLKSSVLLETRTGFIRDNYKRKYKLSKYNIQLEACSWYYALYYPLRHRFTAITKLLYGNVLFMDDIEFYADPKLALSKIQNSKKTYLDGYWQNPCCFGNNEDAIKKDLSLKIKLEDKYLKMANDIVLSNSIAIHLRRVNYERLLELDYYIKSINQIKSQIKNPVFYVFSDDIKWCRENFIMDGIFVFVDNNNEIIDIWLMSQCKHFIIANSTFSWWGAWLSNNPEKIVIMPDANIT
jgi:hypothetical protein